MGLSFTWDRRKAEANLSKHGVSFREASTVFGDASSITIRDARHSVDEERWITIGMSVSGRILVIVHIETDDVIRIISARPATFRERKDYE